MLTGDNGIISKAKEAKDNTEKVAAEERIKIEVLGNLNEYGIPKANKLKSALTAMGATVKGTNLPFLVTLDGYDFTIAEDGTTYGLEKNDMNLAKLKVEMAEIEEKIKKSGK